MREDLFGLKLVGYKYANTISMNIGRGRGVVRCENNNPGIYFFFGNCYVN